MSMDLNKIFDGGLDSYDALSKAAETIATNTFSPEDRSIFSPENLDERVKLLVPKSTPVRNLLPRTRGIGQATAWERLTSKLHSRSGGSAGVGTNTSVAFPDAGQPNETTQTFVVESAAYKLLGRKIELGGMHIAASRGTGQPDAFEQRLNHKMVEVMIGEEEMIMSGNATSNTLEFDGLPSQIVTNSGVATLLTASGIQIYTEAIFNEGGSPDTLIVNPRQQRALADELQVNGGSIQRIMMDDQGRAIGGARLTSIVNSVDGGLIDVYTSRYVGNQAFLLTIRDETGEALIEMEDLIPMSRVDVPSTNYSTTSFIVEASVLKVIGEPYQYKLTGLAL